ncbi:MAG TPA: TolC family outer membrane protein [Burkholderiaceae bacterium]|nr:TolC family outer membrane protein [Burkholderiaceae bacterium]
MTIRLWCSLLAATLWVAPLSAQTLDLVEAYQAALANDAQVAAARAQLEATRERIPQARALQLPAASASAAASRQHVDTDVAPSRDFSPLSFGVSLSYPLYRPVNAVTLQQSRLQVGIAELQYAQAEQDLAVRVAQAYFNVLAALDTLDTVLTQGRAIAEQFEAAKRQFEVGTATITDQQEAQARLDLVRAQEVGARNELAVRRAALEQLVGQPVNRLASLRPGLALTPPQPVDEDAWTSTARQRSYPVRQAELATEVSRQEIQRARLGNYPTVDLVTSVQRAHSGTLATVGVRSTSTAVGVQLSVPLYTGGAIESRVREAIALENRAHHDLTTARRAAEQTARQAFLGVNSGLQQVRALEAAERSSQLALESNLLGYQVGVRINIDVLNAQQQLFTTRRDLARARYDVLINSLVLKAAAGDLGPQDLTSINALLTAL